MAKNRIIYGLFLAICLTFSVAYRSNFSAVLFIAVGLYPPIAAIFTAISLFLAKVDFLSDSYVGEKNRRFDIQIIVQNRFIMPFVPLEISSVLPDSEKGVFEKRRIFVTLQPFGKTTLLLNCSHKYRGSYTCELIRESVVDPFGIIRFSRKLNKKMDMTFLPRKFTIKNIFGNSDKSALFSRSSAKTAQRDDFSHVRDYLDGDALQLVHWKLSAKSDNIMIKEFESISDKNARIICDFASCSKKADAELNFDSIIETALAFSKSLIGAEICAEVDCGDVSRKALISVRYSADYEKLYDIMSVLPANGEMCGLGEMVFEAREQSVIIIITADFDEQTAFLANSAANFATVLAVYVDLEKKPPERDFSQDRFYFMHICGTSGDALRQAAEQTAEKLR